MTRAIAQGPTRNGADVLFKLIHSAARLGPVAGIVHARRDFIDDQARLGNEQFHTHRSDIIQCIQDVGGQKDRICALRR